jgi:hypothetical protein
MKIIFFSPFSNILQHSTIEHIVANQWKNLGHEISFVTCQRILNNHCLAMAEVSLDQNASSKEREFVCKSCVQRTKQFQNSFNFNELNLDSYVSKEDNKNILYAIESVNNSNWMDFEYKNFRIGNLASYEFLITNKINTFEIPEDLFNYYKDQLTNACLVYDAMSKIFLESDFDALVVFDSLYSTNRVAIKLAENLGLQTFVLSSGTDQMNYGNSYSVFRNSQEQLHVARSESWKSYSAKKINTHQAESAIKSFVYSTKGISPFAYSSKIKGLGEKDVASRLNLDMNRKNLLIILSSTDERFAADVVNIQNASILKLDEKNFKNQIDWVKFICSKLAHRDDLNIIVRVHPRLYPNKRENSVAMFATKLETELLDLPKNVTINWPNQEISFHDIAQVVDVAINGTSSTGIDLMMFGIPVICLEPERLFAYPSEFNYIPSSLHDIEKAVDEVLGIGWSLKNLNNALKWKTFMNFEVARSLAEVVPLRRKWTALRLLNGLRFRTALYVPNFFIEYFERREIRRATGSISSSTELGALLELGKGSFPELSLIMDHDAFNNSEFYDASELSELLKLTYQNVLGKVPKRALSLLKD